MRGPRWTTVKRPVVMNRKIPRIVLSHPISYWGHCSFDDFVVIRTFLQKIVLYAATSGASKRTLWATPLEVKEIELVCLRGQSAVTLLLVLELDNVHFHRFSWCKRVCSQRSLPEELRDHRKMGVTLGGVELSNSCSVTNCSNDFA